MRSTKVLITTLLLISSALPGKGQELAPKPIQAPMWTEEVDQPNRLVFPDGRVATLMASDTAARIVRVPFEVIENLCRSQVALPKCSYELGLRVELINFVWTSNPDPARLGQKITIGSGNDYKPLDDDNLLLTNFFKVINPKVSVELPPDRIVCDQFDWLPVDTNNGLARMKIWSGEIMNSNAETQVNENQSFMSYSNLNWRLESNALVFQGLRRTDSSIAIPPLMDTSMTVFEDGAGGCQINIGASLQQVASALSAPRESPLVKTAPHNIKLRYSAPGLYQRLNSLIRSKNYQPESLR